MELHVHRRLSSAAPPSAPRDLSAVALSAEGRLQLSWSPPLVTGGRRDLTYSVACAHCHAGPCVPCGEKVRFEPGPADLRETTVVVAELDAHLNYTLTVEAHSGVSQFSTHRAVASLTTALDYSGEWRNSRVLLLQVFYPERKTENPGLRQRNRVQSPGL